MFFVRVGDLPSNAHINGFNELQREMCLLQLYDFVSNDTLSVDATDEAVDCIRLRWCRTEGVAGVLSSALVYGLLPVDSRRGLLNVLPADYGLDLLGKHIVRKRKVATMNTIETELSPSVFYVNRFHRCMGEMYDFQDDKGKGVEEGI